MYMSVSVNERESNIDEFIPIWAQKPCSNIVIALKTIESFIERVYKWANEWMNKRMSQPMNTHIYMQIAPIVCVSVCVCYDHFPLTNETGTGMEKDY